MKKLCYSFILLVSFLSATIINVPDDYSTIQAGINASDDGDTVLIAQGIYFENLILQKEIVLTSHAIYDDLDSDFHGNENINETIISGPPEPDDPSKGSCLVIRYGDIEPTIFGLTFQDGLGTTMSVSDCGVYRNDRSGGAILIYEAYPTIVYNRFLNNGGGENTGGNVVASVSNGGAISHYDTEDVEFDEDRNNSSGELTFVDFADFDAVDAYILERALDSDESHSNRTVPGTLNIQNNYFEGNSSGDGENVYSHGYEGDIDVSGSVFEDIDCETNTVNEFVLSSIENAADFVQNDISGVCIESNTFYVSGVFGEDSNDGTEEAPLKTIGHALTLVRDAETPTTIYLNPGVYSPSTNGEKFPIVPPDNVHLVGDESDNTILDAEADAGNEAATMIIKEVENVRVANLTLSGGYSEGHGCTGGGGLLLAANDMFNLGSENGESVVPSYPIIENVIIEGNHSHNGGGLAFFRVNGPVLNNVIIRNNTATAFGGGVFSYCSTIDMTDVTITENQNLGQGQGGGIMLAASSGTFDNMAITNNTALSHGGGIWTNNSGGGGDNWADGWTMTNSTISGNSCTMFGGGIMFAWSHPTVINSTISDNTSNWGGGGVFGLESGFTLKETTVSDNASSGGGGGIWVWGPLYGVAPPVIEDCIVSGNETGSNGGGIGLEEDVDATITRTFVVDNHAGGYFGGIVVAGTDATFNNLTISENTSGGGGAIGISQGGHVDLTNSIVWNHSGEYNFGGDGTGSINITYSDIEDGFDGEGNIDADPLFTDVDNGDYTLSTDSPCIDAGTADTDGDGTDDITDYNGSAPDMGAFETTMAAPTGFTLYSLETYVTLLWDAVSIDDFNYYIVERSTDVEFADDVESNALIVNYFEDHDLEYDTEYFYRVYYVAAGANSEYSDVLSVTLEWLDVDGDQLPTVYALHQNYPNPFNPVTNLSYDLPEDAMVNITVFDMMGRVVRTLVNDQQSAGYKSLQWNATNNSGQPISAGLYIYTIQAGEFSQTKKMILLK